MDEFIAQSEDGKRTKYREAGLMVKCRKRRHGVAVERESLERPGKPNAVKSMDFVSDALANGRRIKVLTIVDDFSKECIDLVADYGISGHFVVRVLKQAARFRGYPAAIRTDQGRNSPATRWINGLVSEESR